jgi:hypothetical protein
MIKATSPVPTNEERKKTALAQGAAELQDLSAQPTHLALPRAAAFLADLVRDSSFLRSHVRPALEEAEGTHSWYVARRWDAPD